jgi:sensor histidine kinase regulating citrate/malate metabolism
MRAVRAALAEFGVRFLVLLAAVVAFLCVVVAGAALSVCADAVCAATGDTAIEAASAAANSRVVRELEFEKFTALIF